MKNLFKLIKIVCFTAIAVFTLTAALCGSEPYVSETEDGTNYTLNIADFEGKTSANPQEGDTYELKIKYKNGDVLTTSGIVSNVNTDSGELELTPAGGNETLKITINSDGSMTGIKGNFSLPGGARLALSLSEGDLTTIANGAPPADPVTDSEGETGGFFGNLFGGGKEKADTKSAPPTDPETDTGGGKGGIFAGLFGGGKEKVDTNSAGSDNSSGGNGYGKVDNTRGSLTYGKGVIPAQYNGKYIVAAAYDEKSKEVLFAAGDVKNRTETIIGARVSNGGATLKAWRAENEDLINFNGSGTFTLITCVMEQGTTTKADWDKAQAAMEANPGKASGLFETIIFGVANFSSGKGTASSEVFDYSDLLKELGVDFKGF